MHLPCIFISEHFVYYRGMPFVLPCGSFDSLLLQMLCNLPGTVAFQIKPEDQLYDLCLFGYDDQVTILVLVYPMNFVQFTMTLPFQISSRLPSGCSR